MANTDRSTRAIPLGVLSAMSLAVLAGCDQDPVLAGAPLTVPAATSAAPTKGTGPGAVLASWITQVLEAKYDEACLAAAPGIAPGQDPATTCRNPAMLGFLRDLHDAWARPGVKLPPASKVKVNVKAPQGDTLAVPDTTVTIGGRSLRAIEHTGDQSTWIETNFAVKKVAGAWVVSDFHIGD